MRYPDDSAEGLDAFLQEVPEGTVVDVAPGRYEGPLVIDRPVTLRGAGELTRIIGGRGGRPISISVGARGRVVLDSLRLELGQEEDGGGLLVSAGDVQLRNIHIHQCAARARGGALAVAGGTVVGARLHTLDTSAQHGGAVWVGHNGQLTLTDSQLAQCEATYGGALAVEDSARVDVDGLTVRRARARSGAGGQTLYVRGGSEARPVVRLDRVRFDLGVMGAPVVVDPEHPAEVRLRACDVSGTVRNVAGFVDDGANHWR